MRLKPSRLVSCAVLAGLLAATAGADPTSPAARLKAAAAAPLSPPALDLLVSGVALYPDPVLTLIFDAAQYPAALHQAAETPKTGARANASWPASVAGLTNYPDVLSALDRHIALTARLGVACRTQPDDVWKAVRRARARIEETAAKEGARGTEAPASAVATVTQVLLTSPAAQELSGTSQTTPTTAAATPTTAASSPTAPTTVTTTAVAPVPVPGAPVVGIAVNTGTPPPPGRPVANGPGGPGRPGAKVPNPKAGSPATGRYDQVDARQMSQATKAHNNSWSMVQGGVGGKAQPHTPAAGKGPAPKGPSPAPHGGGKPKKGR